MGHVGEEVALRAIRPLGDVSGLRQPIQCKLFAYGLLQEVMAWPQDEQRHQDDQQYVDREGGPLNRCERGDALRCVLLKAFHNGIQRKKQRVPAHDIDLLKRCFLFFKAAVHDQIMYTSGLSLLASFMHNDGCYDKYKAYDTNNRTDN